MSKALKILVLTVAFGVPLAFIAVLHLFGENEYALPPVEAPVVPGCPETNLDAEGRPVVPPFSFVNQDGEPFTEAALDGKITVAAFVFTTCPTTCPLLTSQMLRAQSQFGPGSGVRFVSFSVDPEHDTPEVLREYAGSYGVDPGNWDFLTGDFEAIRQTARCGFRLLVKEEEASTRIVHSEKVVLLDGQRRVRGYYDGTVDEEIDKLMAEIQLLMLETNGVARK